MGVYIKGVEMPKDGEHPYWVTIHSDGIVEYNENKGQGWQTSEAVPVSDHGRLVDADVLVKENAMAWGTDDIIRIAKAPTIIPADKEEERG